MHHIALALASLLMIDLKRWRVAYLWAVFAVLAAWSVIFAASSWDYSGYLNYVHCIQLNQCDGDLGSKIETSFRVICEIVASFFGIDSGPVVVTFYSLTAILIKLTVFWRHIKYIGVAVFGYVCFGFFLQDMTQIRVGLAIAIVWLAYAQLGQPGGLWRSIPWFVLAILLHNSAIVALIVPALRWIRITPLRSGLLLAGAALLGRVLANSTADLLGLVAGGADARLLAYAAAQEFGILATPQFPIFLVLSVGLLFVFLWTIDLSKVTVFEAICFRSVLCGVMLYLLGFWIPVVSNRVLELLASPLPIVAATIFRYSASALNRSVTVALLSAMFYNAMLRNGLMLDLVIDGQPQQARLLERPGPQR